MTPFTDIALLAAAAAILLQGRFNRRTLMSALDDLAAAEADEEAVLTALLTDIQTLTAELAAVPSSPDNSAEIEAIVAKMKTAQDAARAALAPPTDQQAST